MDSEVQNWEKKNERISPLVNSNHSRPTNLFLTNQFSKSEVWIGCGYPYGSFSTINRADPCTILLLIAVFRSFAKALSVAYG